MNRYIYIDPPGLALLRSQANLQTLAERTVTSRTTKSSSSRGGVGFGAYGISGDFGGGGTSDVSSEESRRLVAEGDLALEAITRKLAAKENLFSVMSIRDVAELIASQSATFVYGSLPFLLEQTIDGDPLTVVIKKQMIEFRVAVEASDDGG